MWIYYWEKYGYAKAEQIFKCDYISDKGYLKNGEPSLVNVLDGKLQFLKMVKGEEDETYGKLKGRFDIVKTVDEIERKENIDFENIIDSILNKGLEAGISLYEKYKDG